MNWKIISNDNVIVNNQLGVSYDLHNLKDCLKLLNELNNYTVLESELTQRIDSLEWENDNLKSENRYLRGYVKKHMINLE